MKRYKPHAISLRQHQHIRLHVVIFVRIFRLADSLPMPCGLLASPDLLRVCAWSAADFVCCARLNFLPS